MPEQIPEGERVPLGGYSDWSISCPSIYPNLLIVGTFSTEPYNLIRYHFLSVSFLPAKDLKPVIIETTCCNMPLGRIHSIPAMAFRLGWLCYGLLQDYGYDHGRDSGQKSFIPARRYCQPSEQNDGANEDDRLGKLTGVLKRERKSYKKFTQEKEGALLTASRFDGFIARSFGGLNNLAKIGKLRL